MSTNWQRTLLRAMGVREHPVTVTSVEDVLPWYRRVTVDARGFLNDREMFPTMWIRLWVPDINRPGALRQRGYTLVDPDQEGDTFALEFVMHERAGSASQWAQNVQPGVEVELSHTPTKLKADLAIGNVILVGDSSAIPAINSILDSLPESTLAHVSLLGTHEQAESLIRMRTRDRLVRADDREMLISGLRDLSVDPDGTYVWAAGERRMITATRDLVRRQWDVPRDRLHAQAYWIEGKATG